MLLELLISGHLQTYKPQPDALVNIKPTLTIEPIEPVSLIEAPQATKLPELSIIPTPKPKAVSRAAVSGNSYIAGQCTHLVASKRYVPNGWGDATNWKNAASRAGWTVSSIPVAGAIGWRYGHVVYVESVGNGTVTITEQNYRWIPFEVRTITIPINSYLYLY